jgi:hypothetical protein
MTKFHHVYNIGDKGPVSLLEDNIKMFLDWSFLNIGGFVNIKIPTQNISSGNLYQLKLSTDPGLTANTSWESPRKDWVYETGVVHNSMSPINISGIYLNNTFLPAPTGSGAYGYKINYPLGKINFNNPVGAKSTVALEYSYRYVQVYKAHDTVWWQEFQQQTYNAAISKTTPNSNISSEHRIQTPLIVVELTDRTYLKPYQLGSSENIVYQDVLLHIFSETPTYRNSLVDMMLLQKEKNLHLIDTQKVVKNGVFSTNINGQFNPNSLNYDQLSYNAQYFTNRYNIKDAVLSETNTISPSLYSGIVRWTLEIFP